MNKNSLMEFLDKEIRYYADLRDKYEDDDNKQTDYWINRVACNILFDLKEKIRVGDFDK